MISTITKTDQGISVTGKLTFDNVSALISEGTSLIKQTVDSTQNDLVIDCNNIERIDSAGIALLLRWKKEVINAKRVCRFEGLSNQVRSLIQAYRLESVVEA